MTSTTTNTPAPSAKFEVGRTYATRSACNHDCIYQFTVVRRTAKFILIKGHHGDQVERRGVCEYQGQEHCKPHGTHSMCPVISAMEDDIIEGGIRHEVEAKARREAQAAQAPAPKANPQLEGLGMEALNQEAQEALDLVVAKHGLDTPRTWSADQILTEANALLRRSQFRVA